MSRYSRPDPVYIFNPETGESEIAPTSDPSENKRREKVAAKEKNEKEVKNKGKKKKK